MVVKNFKVAVANTRPLKLILLILKQNHGVQGRVQVPPRRPAYRGLQGRGSNLLRVRPRGRRQGNRRKLRVENLQQRRGKVPRMREQDQVPRGWGREQAPQLQRSQHHDCRLFTSTAVSAAKSTRAKIETKLTWNILEYEERKPFSLPICTPAR